tara:strand:- start:142 stop:612 length:471 start_codon:yes stop_codon:yes gene_type:complete
MKPTLFKDICGTFPTGVTVITSRKLDKDYGFTANSFTSVSIDPLLVLFCLDKKAKSNDSLKINDFFIVNILSESQKKTCYQFANSKLKPNERFEKVNTKISKNGIKIISESCSFIECKITEIVDGGDHFIYLGLCVDGKINDIEKKPLIYHKGKLL